MGSNQNLFYDVSLHLGTLMAVCIYFRSDLIEMVNSIIKHKSLFNNLLLRQLFISCIPTLFLGLILVDLIDDYLRTSTVIATTTIFFGFVLFLLVLHLGSYLAIPGPQAWSKFGLGMEICLCKFSAKSEFV